MCWKIKSLSIPFVLIHALIKVIYYPILSDLKLHACMLLDEPKISHEFEMCPKYLMNLKCAQNEFEMCPKYLMKFKLEKSFLCTYQSI
jgi:hypothetical protein